MEGTLIDVADIAGFQTLDAFKYDAPSGTTLTTFINKFGVSTSYSVGELTKVSGIFYYRLLYTSGIVRGVLLVSPSIHTVVTPIYVKIGGCEGPFKVNSNLQPVGLLMYEAGDGSVFLIPVEVKSPLLVEVET